MISKAAQYQAVLEILEDRQSLIFTKLMRRVEGSSTSDWFKVVIDEVIEFSKPSQDKNIEDEKFKRLEKLKISCEHFLKIIKPIAIETETKFGHGPETTKLVLELLKTMKLIKFLKDTQDADQILLHLLAE